ncbi:MAG: hypothetical protein RLZZ436_4063 [Planctomycetota bacterium]
MTRQGALSCLLQRFCGLRQLASRTRGIRRLTLARLPRLTLLALALSLLALLTLSLLSLLALLSLLSLALLPLLALLAGTLLTITLLCCALLTISRLARLAGLCGLTIFARLSLLRRLLLLLRRGLLRFRLGFSVHQFCGLLQALQSITDILTHLGGHRVVGVPLSLRGLLSELCSAIELVGGVLSRLAGLLQLRLVEACGCLLTALSSLLGCLSGLAGRR